GAAVSAVRRAPGPGRLLVRRAAAASGDGGAAAAAEYRAAAAARGAPAGAAGLRAGGDRVVRGVRPVRGVHLRQSGVPRAVPGRDRPRGERGRRGAGLLLFDRRTTGRRSGRYGPVAAAGLRRTPRRTGAARRRAALGPAGPGGPEREIGRRSWRASG